MLRIILWPVAFVAFVYLTIPALAVYLLGLGAVNLLKAYSIAKS